MPVTQTPANSSHPFILSDWSVPDLPALASVIAHLVVSRTAHASKILENERTDAGRYSDADIDRALRKLEIGPGSDSERLAKRVHRDGWLFQMVSWVAAFREFPEGLLKAPHPRPADKGLDGLVIRLLDGKVEWVLVSEDKATDDPRGTVRDDVWDEFNRFERGDKDDDLTPESETLLRQVHGLDVSAVTASSGWVRERRYRASVGTSRGSIPPVVHTFEGFDGCVPGGGNERRLANLLVDDDLRAFMDRLCVAVAAALEGMRE